MEHYHSIDKLVLLAVSGGLLSDDTASALPPSNGIFNGLDFGTSASTVSAAQSSPELDLLGVSPTAIPQQRTSQAQQSSDPFGGLGNFGSQQIAEPKSIIPDL